MTDFATVLIITALAGLATGLGALPVFIRAHVSHRTYDNALALAAGMMISASVFGLIIPGIDTGSLFEVISGVFIGGIALLIANYYIPHIHARYRGYHHEGSHSDPPELLSSTRRALLIGGAITFHNAPEGLAIGVAFAAGLEEVAFLLAVIIGLQNIPDGFAFALPMSDTGMSRLRVLTYTTLSGLVPQVLAATAGFFLVAAAVGLFPVAAGVAAGAMIAVVFREMIPSSHGHGYADSATAAFLVGFSLILVVEAIL